MTREIKKNIIVIVIGAFCFLCSSIITHSYTVSANVRFFVYLASYLVISVPMFEDIMTQIETKNFNGENLVILVATVGTMAIGRYQEAIFVMLFFEIASTIEHAVLYRSKKNIENMIDIRPAFAIRKVRGRELQVLPGDLKRNHIIVVKPGERVPVDCVVTLGESTLDTQAITGESMPQTIKVGDRIYSGSINLTGMVEARVSKVYEESTVSKIMDLVEAANENKSEQETLISRFAKFYTPIVAIAAVLIMFVPPVVYGARWGTWIYRALIFMIAACPSGLVLSVPIAFFGGIGAAARNGIMIKGGNHLETLSKVETFIFDKTGTLTEGVFKVKEVKAASVTGEELLEIAAYTESYSNHPIAQSLRDAYPFFIDQQRIESVQELSGYGVSAVFDEKCVCVGNRKLMDKHNISYPENIETPGTVVYVAVENNYVGHIIVGDELKTDVVDMVDFIKNKCHAVTVMLTGDSQSAGEQVSEELGIDFTYTRLLPEDKMEHLTEFMESQDDTERTAFVGDGINDAPVLAMADVGIAMGALGSDAAIEAADIVLMDDEPIRIVDALCIAKETMHVVRQNLAFALIVKILVLVLAGLGYLSMWPAVVADIGVMILSIFNAAFLIKY